VSEWAAGKTVTYKLNGAGQITDSHDNADAGSDTHYEYLAGGRLHKQTITTGTSQTAYYCCDAFGSNTKITGQAGGLGGANCDISATSAQTTLYWFDPFERMRRSQAPDQGAESYSYDGLDRRDTECKAVTRRAARQGRGPIIPMSRLTAQSLLDGLRSARSAP